MSTAADNGPAIRGPDRPGAGSPPTNLNRWFLENPLRASVALAMDDDLSLAGFFELTATRARVRCVRIPPPAEVLPLEGRSREKGRKVAALSAKSSSHPRAEGLLRDTRAWGDLDRSDAYRPAESAVDRAPSAGCPRADLYGHGAPRRTETTQGRGGAEATRSSRIRPSLL